MSDDLKQLKNAMRAAQPAPSDRAANIALAMKNFDALQISRQGSDDQARLTSEEPTMMSRFGSGVIHMFNSLTTRGALAATTSIAAVGIGVFIYTQQGKPGFDLSAPETAVNEIPAHASTDDSEIIVAVEEAPVPQPRSVVEQKIAPSKPAPEEGSAAGAFAPPEVDSIMAEAPPQAKMRMMSPSAMGGVVGHAIVANDTAMPPAPNTETYTNTAANPVKIASDEPVSTFSIDVDTASYSVIRSSIMNGYLPDTAAVRIEEMINYFPYNYPAPKAGEAPFKPTVTVLQTPWNAGTQLVHIGIQGEMPAMDDRPPLNLVFLIDTSGSMAQPNKLPLLIQSFRLMLSELRPEDEVAIVTYAGSAGQVLAPTKVKDKAKIMAALTRLRSGGSTAGQQGLQQAYSVAEGMAKDGEIGRIILATDGDFNVGIQNPDELKTFIAKKRDSGTYLSVLGFGRGNLDDATMQALAQNGNGTAAYIDTLSEAQKVLVDQLGGALFPIANDVKIQMEFNPAKIAEYRLIGYETRALNREDFNNDKVDAGEIGAGHSITAIYEVTPVGSDAILNDALRYQSTDAVGGSSELGFLKLRYKKPGKDTSKLLTTPITSGMGTVTNDIRFSAAIAGFGQLLSGGKYLQDWGYDELIRLANETKGKDAYGYRSEAIKLMRLAQSLGKN